MKVLGLVGEKGSGKQTFVNFLKQIASSSTTNVGAPRNDKREILNIRQVRFSDILAQTLILWDLPVTRANLQNLSLMMDKTFGAQTLANAAKFSIEGDMADVIIFDGIRREEELEIVKGTVIYITADQNLRYQRLKLRSEKVGEVGLSFEQFLKEEKSKAESQILSLAKKADFKIENNGTKEEFKTKIKQLPWGFL